MIPPKSGQVLTNPKPETAPLPKVAPIFPHGTLGKLHGGDVEAVDGEDGFGGAEVAISDVCEDFAFLAGQQRNVIVVEEDEPASVTRRAAETLPKASGTPRLVPRKRHARVRTFLSSRRCPQS
jgi:hypothetical protein